MILRQGKHILRLALGFFLISGFFVAIGTSDAQTNTRPEPLPRDIAKAWLEALFKVDGNALRLFTCAEQSEFLTEESLSGLNEAINMADLIIETTQIIYDYDAETREVTLAGVLGFTFEGDYLEFPMTDFPFANLPIVQESRQWRVCLDVDLILTP